ncbi:MAG: HEPN domain-containing protein [Deltaproteobacteria bacterium]|nr:HEPN domain-containing protein [Deltaproteobacteria bacterium]
MNRGELQDLAGQRLREARALLENGHYAGAYHLAGLAVECALKACIAKSMKRFEFPDKKFAADCFDHDLTKLRKLAGLEAAFDADARATPKLGVNWQIVKDWTIESRYERKTAQEAADLYSAIHRQKTGVLRWIRQHW